LDDGLDSREIAKPAKTLGLPVVIFDGLTPSAASPVSPDLYRAECSIEISGLLGSWRL
jgi:hypothetical protein